MSTEYIPLEIRRLVRFRAGECCEYCLAPQALCFHSHQVDHIVAQKHGGETLEENLALSCIACNQFKGSDVASYDPVTGYLTALFNPRQQSWREHFDLSGLFVTGRTATGRVTVKVLQMNAPDRILEREWFLIAGELKT